MQKCYLCDKEFSNSRPSSGLQDMFYCESCRANRSELFVSETPKVSSIRYDFEASLRFLSSEEGGRNSTAIVQGYRSDFKYKDGLEELVMIWPSFLSAGGVPLEKGTIVDTSKPLRAFMTIISDEGRLSVHQKRLAPGVEFCLCEGNRAVAEGTVVRILDLHLD